MSLRSLVRILFRGSDPELEERLRQERGPDRRQRPRVDMEAVERRLKTAQANFDDAIAGVVAFNENEREKRDARPTT